MCMGDLAVEIRRIYVGGWMCEWRLREIYKERREGFSTFGGKCGQNKVLWVFNSQKKKFFIKVDCDRRQANHIQRDAIHRANLVN